MHTAGIKFGLSHDVLQLRGADVVVSDALFEHISAQARRSIKLGKRGVHALDIWNRAVNRGLQQVLQHTTAPRQEAVPFFTRLDQIVAESIMFFAEKSELGRKLGREFLIERTFWDEFGDRIQKLNFGPDLDKARKLLFFECCDTVRNLCEIFDPENRRHADLFALFVFLQLDRSGAIETLARLRSAGS